MKEKVTLKTVAQRAKAKTPDFWKRVQKASVGVGISLVAVLTAETQLSLELSIGLLTVIKYSIAVCTAIAGTAQFTKE